MDDGVDIEVETDDVDIDRLPANRDPPIIYETFETVVSYLASYGWYLLIGLVICYFVWKKYQHALYNLSDAALTTHKKLDSSEIEARQLAVDAHRRRLQAEFDRKAAIHAEKQAELEAKKRQERLEDWERHQAGLGYRSKVKKQSDEPQSTTVIPRKSSKTLRDPNYSPLGGAGGPEGSWRPSRRGPAAGGG